MEIRRFKKLFEHQGDLPEDFDWDRYEKETGRPIPSEVKNGNLMSLLFVSWVRAEVSLYKRSKR